MRWWSAQNPTERAGIVAGVVIAVGVALMGLFPELREAVTRALDGMVR